MNYLCNKCMSTCTLNTELALLNKIIALWIKMMIKLWSFYLAMKQAASSGRKATRNDLLSTWRNSFGILIREFSEGRKDFKEVPTLILM